MEELNRQQIEELAEFQLLNEWNQQVKLEYGNKD